MPFNPFPIRMCYFDVDGTLVDDSRSIIPALEAAIGLCHRQGIRMGLATGRTYLSALPYARAIGADAPLILFNGARVQAPETGAVLYDRSVAVEEARQVIRLAMDLGLDVNLYLDDAIYIERETAELQAFALKDGVRQQPVGDLTAFLHRDATKILVIGPGSKLERLKERFDARPHEAAIVRSEPTFLEILPPGVNKGTALTEVARLTGIPLAAIAAFGDYDNDEEMLARAGLGVAVANASDRLKAAADYVCRGRHGEGVAEALTERVLGLKSE